MNSTIHWHVLKLNYLSDDVPDLTQVTVKPGLSYPYKLAYKVTKT
jgi:FtsP/CotA-like multicopper oxidase with cupredoxin domain